MFGKHNEGIEAVAFIGDGRTALSGSWGDLKQWDLADGKEIRTYRASGATAIAVAPSGDLALSGSLEDIDLWRLSDGTKIYTLKRKGNRHYVKSLAFAPDTRTAIAGTQAGYFHVWDLATGLPLQEWSIDTRTGQLIRPSAHQIFPTPETDLFGHVQLAVIEQVPSPPAQPSGGVRTKAIAFSSDLRIAIVAGEDMTLKIWDLAERRLIHSFIWEVEAVAIAPGNRFAYTVGQMPLSTSPVFSTWDLMEKRRLERSFYHGSMVGVDSGIAIASNGKIAITASVPNTLSVWDLEKNLPMHGLRDEANPTIRSVAISPDGRTALSGHGDGSLRLWDISRS